MIPGQFDYVRATSLDDALRILNEREGEAKLLSGGYSLLPLLKLRLAQTGLLVDLRDVTGLDGIVETDDELRIGARATHRQINEHPIIRDRYPMLAELSGGIGDPQVRNWGTIGGSIARGTTRRRPSKSSRRVFARTYTWNRSAPNSKISSARR